MGVRSEVIPFIAASLLAGAVLGGICRAAGAGGRPAFVAGALLAVVASAYMLYFFRDPERTAPADESIIVAGADGHITGIADVREDNVLKTDAVRVSIFLSLFDVHVNRAPIAGKSTFIGYFKGKHFFTFKEKSSEYNQHNKILIEGARTRCLVCQIVGPVARRVVYFLDPAGPVEVAKGDRIGMMKFGSRLDMYFPRNDVEVLVKQGDRVYAGVTPVARLK